MIELARDISYSKLSPTMNIYVSALYENSQQDAWDEANEADNKFDEIPDNQ